MKGAEGKVTHKEPGRAAFLGRAKMDKELHYRDIGLDCDLMVCGKTEEEVLLKASEHAQAMHNIKGFSQELYDKARAAIHEGYCDYGDAEEMIPEECSACYEACFDCTDECCC
jgi:predicted small metal-binding protein